MSATAKKSASTWKGSRPKNLTRVSAHVYQQASWTRDDLTFEQHLPSRTCSCEAGEKGHWCKHMTSALLASFVDNIDVARQMPPALRRKLLSQGTHVGRVDIECALIVAEWEEQRDQQNAPEPEPEPAVRWVLTEKGQEELEKQDHPVRLPSSDRRRIASQERREHDAAKVAGWQQHSEEVAALAAAEFPTDAAARKKVFA